MKTYSQSELDAALVAMVEKCAALTHEGGNCQAAPWIYERIMEQLPADIVASVERERRKLQLGATKEAIIQCAIEAGERSPEGVSSHTMLGDMWDRRIAALEAELNKANSAEGKTAAS